MMGNDSGCFRVWGIVGALAAAYMVCGCGGTPTPAKSPAAASAKTDKAGAPAVHNLEALAMRGVVGPDGSTVVVHYSARELLERGNFALERSRWASAIAIYEQLVREFPSSSLRVAALYNAGLAWEKLDDNARAIAVYRSLIAHTPAGPDSVDAQIRIAVVLTRTKRWRDAIREFEQVLARTDLEPADRVEALTRMGQSLIEEARYTRAEHVLSEAISYFETVEKTLRLDTDQYVAMANYYLGQVPHRQALAFPLRNEGPFGEHQFKNDVDRKNKLLGIAFERYETALNRLDPYWSTASAYQMSQMYRELWESIVRAAIPAGITPARAGFHRRARYRKARWLLDRALQGHLKSVELADKFGSATPWSTASRRQAESLAQLVARLDAGELVEVSARPRTFVPDPGQGEVRSEGDYVPGRIGL